MTSARPFTTARFFDGRSNRPHPAHVTIGGGWLEVRAAEDGALLARASLDRVRALDRRGDEWVRLALAEEDARRLVLEGREAVTALAAAAPDVKLRRAFSRDVKQIALWGGGAAASIALLLLVVLPWAVDRASPLIPDSFLDQLGRAVEQEVVAAVGVGPDGAPVDEAGEAYCRDTPAQIQLARLAADLAEAVGATAPRGLAVIRSDAANALALPGGRILILSPLLEMSDGPNGFAAVLAHEIGHLREHHPTRAAMHAIGVGALIGLLIGDVSGGTVFVTAVEAGLTNRYSREKEREADAIALEAMERLGYDVQPFADMLDQFAALEAESGADEIPGFLSTHPDTAARSADVRARGRGGADALDAEAWRAIREMCE